MGVLKLVGTDVLQQDSVAAEAGIYAEELVVGKTGKKLSFLSATPVVKQTIADLGAWVTVINSPGLAIGTSSKAKVKIVNTTYYMVGSAIYSKASAEITLSGTTVNAKFAAYMLTINAAGTVTVAKSADADTLAAVVLPSIPASEACLGFVIINPTGTGNFVGGTTELDDGTVIPNTVYLNMPESAVLHTKVQAVIDALQAYGLS